MSRRNIILLVVALLIAGVTAFAMSAQMGAGEQQAEVEVQKLENRVLIARGDIAMGSFVRTGEQLEWRQLEEGKAASPDLIREENEDIRSFEGAIARRSYRIGEPVKSGSLIKPGSGGFLSAVLEPGMRAVSLAVNATTGNAGFIFPGDFVDVILVHNVRSRDAVTGEESEYIFSNTFVHKVRVVAVDQALDNPENKAMLAKTVTIEVTPKQAESVQVANEMGKVSFALRSMSDNTVDLTEEDGMSEDFIAALEQNAVDDSFTSSHDVSPALRSGSYGDTIRVLRGQTTSNQSFSAPTEQPQ